MNGHCEFCRAPATGHVNERRFCSKPACIQRAFDAAFKLVSAQLDYWRDISKRVGARSQAVRR